jgi:hypothetical protein
MLNMNNTTGTTSGVVFVLFCIYTPTTCSKTDCQLSRRSILNSLGLQRVFWWPVHFFPGFVKYGSIVAKDWYLVDFPDFWKINGWNALTLWTPISCCAPGLLSYSYYFAYIPPTTCSPRPIINLVGGLFWILSDSNVSLEEQIWPTECIYLANYFKFREKKEKTEWNVFFNHMVGIKTTGE